MQEILTNQNSFATSILLVVVDNFGSEVSSWHPVVLREKVSSLIDDKDGISEHNFNKLMVGIELSKKDEFFKDPTIMSSFSTVLNNKIVDLSLIFPVADLFDLAWGLTEARIIHNHDPLYDLQKLLSIETTAYIDVTLQLHDFSILPKFMKYKDNVLLADLEKVPEDIHKYVLKSGSEYAGEVDRFVREKLSRLALELASLKLKNGEVEDTIANIVAAIES